MSFLQKQKALLAEKQIFVKGDQTISSELFFETGQAPAWELACQLAQYHQQSSSPSSQVFFLYPLEGHFLFDVAKLRAHHLLMKKLGKPQDPPVYAVSGLRRYSVRSSWNNLLKAGAQTLTSIWGGTQGIFLYPHDTVARKTDGNQTSFSQDLLLSLQRMSVHESHLPHVQDPWWGSGAMETLTDQLAQDAWNLYLKIEAAGGLIPFLQSSFYEEEMVKQRQRLFKDLRTKKELLTGVNDFPPKEEKTTLEEENYLLQLGQQSESWEKQEKKLLTKEELFQPWRYAQMYETFYGKQKLFLKKWGKLPQILCVLCEKSSLFYERIQFVQNLFQLGGFDVQLIQHDEIVDSTDPYVAAICLLGTDKGYETYQEQWGQICDRLPVTSIYVTGHPKKCEASVQVFQKKKTPSFIYSGMDVIALYDQLWTTMLTRKPL
jgi:methylmalonyl-CoA mutase